MNQFVPSGEATVTGCAQADLPAVKLRFAEWFKFNPRLQEDNYLDWQFRSSPGRPKSENYDLLLLRRDNEIAGCIGYSYFQFRHDGAIHRGAWPHNWINASPNRSDGLLLLSAFQEKSENRIMMRLSEDAVRMHRLYRVPILDRLPRWWAAPDPAALRSILSEHRDRLAGIDWPTVEKSSRAFLANVKAPVGEELKRVPDGQEFALSSWKSIRSAALRDASYLNWRYLDAPKHDYRIISAGNDLAVYRREPVMNTDAHTVRIMEWTVNPERASSLMARIVEQAGVAGCALIDFHCTAEDVGNSLCPLGFVRELDRATGLPDLFRPTFWSGGYHVAIDLPPHRRPRTIDFNSWYITAGDSDIDRVKL